MSIPLVWAQPLLKVKTMPPPFSEVIISIMIIIKTIIIFMIKGQIRIMIEIMMIMVIIIMIMVVTKEKMIILIMITMIILIGIMKKTIKTELNI